MILTSGDTDECDDRGEQQALDGTPEGGAVQQGKATISEASRQFDLQPSQIEEWVEHARAGEENAQKAKPEDMREEYEPQMKKCQEAYGEAMLELDAR